MDVVELMGVPVRAVCLGQVGGGAVGVVAVCAARAAMPSTRFALREPLSGHTTLPSRNVAQWAELQADERERFCNRVADAAKQSLDRVRQDFVRGLFLSADDAVEYGLIDEVARPDASIHQLPGSGSPMGFRPLR
jgi:ATP-dependent Clp protease protease subunit